MVAQSLTGNAAIPPMERMVVFWKRNGLKESTIFQYRHWVCRFLSDCQERGVSPLQHLRADEVKAFARCYARFKGIDRDASERMAGKSLHAWSVGLAALGYVTPQWKEPNAHKRCLHPFIAEFVVYRRDHSNAVDSSIDRDVAAISSWMEFLRSRHRSVQRVQLRDVDDYLLKLRRRYAIATIGRSLSSIRLFLRFLHCTGRLKHDLAVSVQAPPRRRVEPPRALPWPDVQRIIRAIDKSTRTGLRDYTMLLLMSLYGLGAAEVISLKLDDIHWRAETLRVRRPKTGVAIELPLLPAAARVLAAYLRRVRPPDAPTRSVFIRHKVPLVAFSSSAIRFAIRKYATKAGIKAQTLGAHVLRHSHASRQVDQEAPPRVLSSILGHRDPESTSAYTRVAVERLRVIALPVPR
jgi:integrase/recombinase XerD